MAKKMQVYKCELCGNIIEVVHAGPGQLVCCGQPMVLMSEKTQDAGMEKHLPVAEATAHGVKVNVGSIPHPMDDDHYIEWVEVVEVCGNVHQKFLNPGETPQAMFDLCCDIQEVRSYCNKHGHWSSKDVKSGGCDHCCG